MIQTAIALILIVLTLTVWVTMKARGRTLSAAWVAPLYGGLLCVGIAVVTTVWYSTNIRNYDRCVTQAERSIGNNEQSTQLYDTIDAAVQTGHYTHDVILPGQLSLRDSLQVRLPLLDPLDCEKP